MDLGSLNTVAAAQLLDEFERCGMRHVCLSPGGRSTPLAAALATSSLRTHVITDERGAGFFALGLAQADRRPVLLVCTSGTAAANFAPAVAEACFAEIPLILLTADRPPELRDCGAAQTIRQLGLFGNHLKWSIEVATPSEGVDLDAYRRTLACRAVARASEAPAGPVHLNLPFREPLVADEATLDLGTARPGHTPWVVIETGRVQPGTTAIARFAETAARKRGWIVCGPRTPLEAADGIAHLADRLCWPIFADPLSGLRYGPAATTGRVVDSYDVLLREPQLADAYEPEMILRFGALPTSKPLQRRLTATTARQVVAGVEHTWGDPTFAAADVVYGDAAIFCRESLRALESQPPADSAWASHWAQLSRQVRARLAARLCDTQPLFEGAIPEHLLAALPADACLVVGSSMPVRDLDTFSAARPQPLRIFSNRGANGIDGVVATALGIAAASGSPTYLLIGDVSFLHDIGALQIAARLQLDLCIVVPNNDGGGIFSFLPQSRLGNAFEPFFGTPHGLDLAPAVQMCGGRHVRATSLRALQAAVADFAAGSGLRVIEVPTERAHNVVEHRRIVADTLAELMPLRREVA